MHKSMHWNLTNYRLNMIKQSRSNIRTSKKNQKEIFHTKETPSPGCSKLVLVVSFFWCRRFSIISSALSVRPHREKLQLARSYQARTMFVLHICYTQSAIWSLSIFPKTIPLFYRSTMNYIIFSIIMSSSVIILTHISSMCHKIIKSSRGFTTWRVFFVAWISRVLRKASKSTASTVGQILGSWRCFLSRTCFSLVEK